MTKPQCPSSNTPTFDMKAFIPISALISIMFFSANCKSVAKSTITLDAIVLNKLGKNAAVKNNASNTYALCYELGGGGQHISKRMRFMVVKLSNLQIVAEDFFGLNQVKWKSDTQIEYLPADQSIVSSAEPTLKVLKINTAEY
jgi:hypothetical protein